MSKRNKIITVVSILTVLATAVLVYFFVIKKTNTTPTPSSAQNQPTSNIRDEVKPDVEYNDASGFSFNHPKAIKIADITPEDDDSYYTLLSLEKGTEEATIDIKDAEYKTLEKWIDKNTDFDGLQLKGATSLDGISATQYEGDNSLITLAIDQNVAYTIKTPKTDYWDQIHDMILTTFKFAGSETKSSGSGSSGAATNIIYEAEEVIE